MVSKATVWLWVRTRMPARVWRRCMEFQKTGERGNIGTYHIDTKTGIVKEVLLFFLLVKNMLYLLLHVPNFGSLFAFIFIISLS